MNENNNRPNKGRSIFKIFFFIFLAIFLVAAGMLIQRKIQEENAYNLLREMQEKANTETTAAAPVVPPTSRAPETTPAATKEKEETTVGETETESETEPKTEDGRLYVDIVAERGIDIPVKYLDWDGYQAMNEDVYAWIYVPGTYVDYPVLQSPEAPDYYLRRNLDRSEGYPGCIYTEFYNSKDFLDRQTVLYGHNMPSGTMFTSLLWFQDVGFFEDNPYFFIYTPNGTYVYEIFAAYPADTRHVLLGYDYSTDISYQYYLDGIRTVRDLTAHFRYDVELTTKNHIVTLSTCDGPGYDHRYLIQGVLVNDPTIYATPEEIAAYEAEKAASEAPEEEALEEEQPAETEEVPQGGPEVPEE